jgi:Zn-dependent M28 family amino/carboxypeptidase
MILLGRVDAARALLPAQYPQDVRPQVLPARFTGAAVTAHERLTGHNVVAVLRGSNPALARTYVGLGAHHDHAGIQPAVNGDSIANGADDDGSGSMALLAVARSMVSAPRPRRSVLFVWHTAEEKGLLGSAHFAANPTVPIDSIVAMVNADMIGRNGGPTEDFASEGIAPDDDRLYIVGPGAAPNSQSRVLGTIVDSVNARLPDPFAFDRTWDTPDHPERIYFRSDHYSYAQHGVPIVFFTTGLHEDYHKVSDEVGKIDFPKLARVSALMRDVVTAVANRTSRPH